MSESTQDTQKDALRRFASVRVAQILEVGTPEAKQALKEMLASLGNDAETTYANEYVWRLWRACYGD